MIRKGIDVELNVKPVFLALYHKASYEGPCRFGAGDALKIGFDQHLNQELYKGFVKKCEENFPEGVKVVDPVMIERSDDWESPECFFEEMLGDRENVDLYFVNLGLGRSDLLLEFAARYNVPIALDPDLNFISGTAAALYNRGAEVYCHFTWNDMRTQMRALRARKAIKKMRVLTLPRFNSTTALAGADSFNNLDEITSKFGTIFRPRNLHEFLDQMTPATEDGNPTTPGRITLDLDENDMKEVDEISEQLMGHACVVDVKSEYVKSTISAYVLAKKWLNALECNAFVAPCPDACSTRRLHELNFTFCMTHSLLISQGIPSACEYDIAAAVSMMPLMVLSNSSAFMGNTAAIPLVDGKLQTAALPTLDTSQIDALEDKSNLYFSQHSTATLKMCGFNQPTKEYGLRHFAFEKGFGAIVRYDYAQDAGTPVTLCRFSGDGKSMFVGKGTIVAGGGFDRNNCHGNIIYRVADNMDFANKQKRFGNHVPLVYGDYVKELVMMGEAMGLEVVTA